MIKIKLTVFQRSNLLQLMNRITVQGVDEANALMELYKLIQSAEDDNKEDK